MNPIDSIRMAIWERFAEDVTVPADLGGLEGVAQIVRHRVCRS